jgi:GAF domain-containing protein
MAGLDDLQVALLEVHQASAGDLVSMLDLVAHSVTKAIDPCRWASVTVMDGRDPSTVAYRGSEALEIDEVQYRTLSGPCVDAARTFTVQHLDDTADAGRWPEFRDVAERVGIRSVISVPFAEEGIPWGALNLYADAPQRFDAEDVAAAELIAVHLTTAISNELRLARAEELARNLQAGLVTRDVIGRAKGILMQERKIGDDEAFDLLRRASQARNVKLRDVADEVARTGALDDGWAGAATSTPEASRPRDRGRS